MNSTTLASSITNAVIAPADDRQRLADRIFYIAVAVNAALTLFCLVAMFSGFGTRIAGDFRFDTRTLATCSSLSSSSTCSGPWSGSA